MPQSGLSSSPHGAEYRGNLVAHTAGTVTSSEQRAYWIDQAEQRR